MVHYLDLVEYSEEYNTMQPLDWEWDTMDIFYRAVNIWETVNILSSAVHATLGTQAKAV